MDPTTLTARTPEDLIALAPLVLGFQPEESLVMLSFGEHAFHARIDLPGSPSDVDEVVRALLVPVVAHGLARVVFLVFSAAPLRSPLVSVLLEAFLGQGVEVIDILQADGRRWFRLRPEGRGPDMAYDVSGHPFHARAVVEGQVTWSSRRALAASMAPEGPRVAAMAARLGELPRRLRAGQRPAEETWLLATMAAADGGQTLDEAGHARLLRDVADRELWATALLYQTRERSTTQTALWTSVLRSAPEGWADGPAALLGFVAWLGGHGAMAWCAVDRCLAEAPDDERALALGHLLMNAVPPSRWPQVGDHAAQDPA